MTKIIPQRERCPHCGANLQARWEPLNPGLVRCLLKAIEAVYRKGENRFHWHKDIRLTNNESHNFQKLRFHGLIAHADEENPKSGYWLITKRGGAFLRGEIAVPKKVLIFRNKVQDHSSELIHIKELKHKLPEFPSYEQYAYVPFLMPKVEDSMPLFAAA